MSANERQVAGEHYKNKDLQHWDFAAAQGMDYFQGQITKYVARWKKKNGIVDLEKALHFLEKYIELEKAKSLEGKNNSGPIVLGSKTEMQHPFGYDPNLELDDQSILCPTPPYLAPLPFLARGTLTAPVQCQHPLMGVLQNDIVGKDI